MNKVWVFFALVAFACGDSQPKPRLDGRIVGGQEANIQDYPYQLSLQYYGSHICGATIVASKVAITAAHCTDGSRAESLSVRAGSSIRGSGGQVVQVEQIYQNPQYDSWDIDYDISVLILSSEIELGEGAEPVALPPQGRETEAGSTATCSGWGTLSEGGSLPSQLQVVQVPIVSQAECKAAYGANAITDRMLCAGFTRGGQDACQGDSGGPLIVGAELVGVVSWGYGCARPNYPGVYSSVASMRKYISDVSGL